jgi:energy-coupling factor transport system permease protein
MGLFSYYEGDSFVHKLNPSIKLLSVFLVVIVLTLAQDPYTPGIFLFLTLSVLWLVGGIPLKVIVKSTWPLVILTIPFFVFNTLYFDIGRVANPHIWFRLGPWIVAREGAISGLALSLRILAFIACSLFFVVTTDPSDFALSLIQQAHIPYRFGYAILVAYRFIPLWTEELETIRAAHKVRGVGKRGGLKGKIRELQRYAVPLLASAIRKSERVAIAMDSRAFGSTDKRTYYRELHVWTADWAFLVAVLLSLAAIFAVLSSLGLTAGFGAIPE